MRYWPFVLILLAGCARKPDSNRHPRSAYGDSTLAGNPFGFSKEKYLGQLAATMVGGDKVIMGGVGIGGVMTPEFDSYKRLLAIAPDSFWIGLSYSKSPVARAYAIQALREKKSPYLMLVAERLRTDTATVEWSSGCMTSPASISCLIQLLSK